MSVRQFLKRKRISDSRSVENNSEKNSDVSCAQQAKANESASKVVVDSSSLFHTQLYGVRNDDDSYAPNQEKL